MADRRSSRSAGHVRIIGGQWKRRSLAVADVPGLRPTPDRVRETLFNWLAHGFDGGLGGRSVLDLFAGSGALGIEAASRGASPVTLVDSHATALDALRQAQRVLGASQLEIIGGDAMRVAATLIESKRTFDVIFLDPPFGQRWLDRILPAASALCAPGGYIYVEAEESLPALLPIPDGVELHRADKAGGVFYHLLRRNI